MGPVTISPVLVLRLLAGTSSEKPSSSVTFPPRAASVNDASSTFTEKQQRIADLEQQVKDLQVSIDQYVVQAQEVAREVEKLRSEKHETVASMEASQNIDRINEALAGISTSGIDDRLNEIRRRRDENIGRAKASARVAGTDVSLQRAKLRKAARAHVHTKDFLEAAGMAPEKVVTEEKAPEVPAEDKLPE